MKISTVLYFFSLFIFAVSNAQEKLEDLQTSPLLQKIYLNPDSVIVSQNGIDIECEGNVLSISCLFLDEEGVFTLVPKWYAWRCGCGATNPGHANVCWQCHNLK